MFNYGDAEDEKGVGPFGNSNTYYARYASNLLGLAARFPSLGKGPVVAASTLPLPRPCNMLAKRNRNPRRCVLRCATSSEGPRADPRVV